MKKKLTTNAPRTIGYATTFCDLMHMSVATYLVHIRVKQTWFSLLVYGCIWKTNEGPPCGNPLQVHHYAFDSWTWNVNKKRKEVDKQWVPSNDLIEAQGLSIWFLLGGFRGFHGL